MRVLQQTKGESTYMHMQGQTTKDANVIIYYLSS